MRTLIVTMGSRGDVAPYLGLGRYLADNGHQVAIAAHDRFERSVRESGLQWRRLPGDPQALIADRMRSADVMDTFLTGLGDGIVDAVEQGTDVVLTCLGQAPLSLLAADALGLPSMGVYLIPSIPTDRFALPRATWVQLLDDYSHDLGREGASTASRRFDQEPAPTQSGEVDAALAEFLARRDGWVPPAWARKLERYSSTWWFVTPLKGMHPTALQESPASFRKRGVFITAGALSRA